MSQGRYSDTEALQGCPSQDEDRAQLAFLLQSHPAVRSIVSCYSDKRNLVNNSYNKEPWESELRGDRREPCGEGR